MSASLIVRDRAVESVTQQLAVRATYIGEPLVRLAQSRSSDSEVLQGLFRQEVVRGPRVFELEAAAKIRISTQFSPIRKPSPEGFGLG